MSSVYISYAITEMCLIILAFVIYSKLDINIGTEYEVKRLKSLIWSYIVVLVTDIFWAITEAGVIIPPKLLNAAFNGVSISAVALGCYYWYDYIMNRLHYHFTKVKRIAAAIPGMAVIALNMMSIFTGWVFQIDENHHYVYGPLFFLQAIVTYGYLLTATVCSFIKARRIHSKLERREYVVYGLYMLPPLVSGLIEDFFPGAPILCMCMFIAILIVFITIQDSQIFNDALTGLSNRRKLEIFL